MKHSLFSIFVISVLVSCSSLKISGSINDKTYISPDNEFSVAVPGIPSLGAKDTVFEAQTFVDFYLGSGYWEIFGLYSIEWVKVSGVIDNQKFIEIAPVLADEQVKKRFGESGEFKIIRGGMENEKRIGYQLIASGTLEGKPVKWGCTIYNFRNRIAFISYINLEKNLNFSEKSVLDDTWYINMLNSFSRL